MKFTVYALISCNSHLQNKRHNIILKYVCHLCVCSTQLYMENYLLSRQPKLLSQTTLSCTWCMTPWSKWLHVRARGHVTLCLVSTCLFSCTRSLCYWSFDFPEEAFCSSAFSCITLPVKKYTRVSGDKLCILFMRFAMDVCHLCQMF